MEQLTGYSFWLGIVGLLFAWAVYAYVKGQSTGSEFMTDLSDQIHEGAMTFLRREYSVLVPFVLVVAAALYVLIGGRTAIAYVFGAAGSGLAGFFGMQAATRANVRTTEAARAHGQSRALRVAFSGGAVMGLAVAALGMAGLGAVWLVYQPESVGFRPFGEIISGFAMGASSIALFARVGGGIYTKAADVGADLVGKVEEGMP
ncbi:MAG: sodium/proton-translocating pyrophosphatase, partial [Gemmatimonadota bacterium]